MNNSTQNKDKNLEIHIIRKAIEKGVTDTLESFAVAKVASVEAGDIECSNEYTLKKGVFIMIGLIGGFPGRIVYRFSCETAANMASKMMGTTFTPDQELDAIALSALSEFVNISSGTAIRSNETAQYELDITPPTTIRGEDMVVNIHQGAVYSFMHINDIGRLDIFTSLS